jgi:ATP-binding cassette, subfamily B (MDR/TAP), member 7
MLSCRRLRRSTLSSAFLRVQNKTQNVHPHHIASAFFSSITSDDSSKSVTESRSDRRETDVRILRELGQHLWPDNSHPHSQSLKARVVAAVSLLVASKLINIQVPFLFKALVDSFEVDHTTLVNNMGDPLILATPIAVVLGYGIARASASLAAECRSAIFAPVAHDAIRQGEFKPTVASWFNSAC